MNRHRLFTPLVLPWLLLLSCDTGGQLSLKLGSAAVEGLPFGLPWIATAVSSPFVWLGMSCYLGSFLSWMLILHRSNLSFAFPITALVYVNVLLASWLLLGESVNVWRWVGVAVIVTGVAIGGGDRPPQAAGDER